MKGLGLVQKGKDNTSPDAQRALGRLGGVRCPTPDSADNSLEKEFGLWKILGAVAGVLKPNESIPRRTLRPMRAL